MEVDTEDGGSSSSSSLVMSYLMSRCNINLDTVFIVVQVLDLCCVPPVYIVLLAVCSSRAQKCNVCCSVLCRPV